MIRAMMMGLFLFFMIFMVRGFMLQSSKKERDKINRDKKEDK